MMYPNCSSATSISEKLPTGPFGPLSMKKFGKPGTEIERYAFGRSDHAASSVDAVATRDRHRSRERVGLETGRQHQDVQLVEATIVGAHATGFDPFDRVGHELGMGPLDRRVEVRRHDETLARGAVVGAQPLAEFGIGDALLEVGDAHVLDHFDLRRVRVHHRLGEQAEELREVRVHLLELARVASVGFLLLVGVRRILLRHDPLRGSLEQRQVRDPIHDRGRDLHGGGAGPDDADTCAVNLTSWSQRALWKMAPAKVSRPSMSG